MKEYLGERKFEDIDPDNIDNTWDDLLWKGYQTWVRHANRIKKSIDADPDLVDLSEIDCTYIIKQRIDLLIVETLRQYPDWTNREVAEFVDIPIQLVRDVEKGFKENKSFFENKKFPIGS